MCWIEKQLFDCRVLCHQQDVQRLVDLQEISFEHLLECRKGIRDSMNNWAMKRRNASWRFRISPDESKFNSLLPISWLQNKFAIKSVAEIVVTLNFLACKCLSILEVEVSGAEYVREHVRHSYSAISEVPASLLSPSASALASLFFDRLRFFAWERILVILTNFPYFSRTFCNLKKRTDKSASSEL